MWNKYHPFINFIDQFLYNSLSAKFAASCPSVRKLVVNGYVLIGNVENNFFKTNKTIKPLFQYKYKSFGELFSFLSTNRGILYLGRRVQNAPSLEN